MAATIFTIRFWKPLWQLSKVHPRERLGESKLDKKTSRRKDRKCWNQGWTLVAMTDFQQHDFNHWEQDRLYGEGMECIWWPHVPHKLCIVYPSVGAQRQVIVKFPSTYISIFSWKRSTPCKHTLQYTYSINIKHLYERQCARIDRSDSVACPVTGGGQRSFRNCNEP